jgi:hypothetical protein
MWSVIGNKRFGGLSFTLKVEQQDSVKHQHHTTSLHDITTQKTMTQIFITMKTSNLVFESSFFIIHEISILLKEYHGFILNLKNHNWNNSTSF